MPPTANREFDAAFFDKENRAVALIEVKINPLGSEWASILRQQLARFPEHVDFVLAIDPACIQLYKAAEGKLGDQVVNLDTRQVLQNYDPEFTKRRVFESYLVTLVEAWLRDLAYHWKSESPPGSEELRRAGLLEKLEGGTTQPLGA